MKHLLLASALLLAGCSDGPAPVNDQQAEAAVARAERSSGGVPPVKGLPIDSDRDKLTPGAMPPAFEGRWGITPADCDIARNDNHGLLIIRGNTLTFFEATAKAKVIGGPTRYKVVADLTFGGDGAPGPTRESLELTSAGTVLLRTTASPAKTYRYDHC